MATLDPSGNFAMSQSWGGRYAMWRGSSAVKFLQRIWKSVVRFTSLPTLLGSTFLVAILFVLIGLPLWKTILSIREERRLSRSGICLEFLGNQDVYGLGIRIAAYLQVGITSFLDFYTYEQYAAAFASANIWFLFALFVALCTMLLDPQTPPLDLYITISMGNGIMGNLLAGVVYAPVAHIPETTLTQIGRAVTGLLWHICTTIYWWKLMPISLATRTEHESSSCPLNGWIFVRVPLESNSPLQKVHKAFNILTWASLTVIWFHVLYLTCTMVRYVLFTLDPESLRVGLEPPVGQAEPNATEDIRCPLPTPPQIVIVAESSEDISLATPRNVMVTASHKLEQTSPVHLIQHRPSLPSKLTILFDLLCNCPNGHLQVLFGYLKAEPGLYLRHAYLGQRHFPNQQHPTPLILPQVNIEKLQHTMTPEVYNGLVYLSFLINIFSICGVTLSGFLSLVWVVWTILNIEFTLTLNNVFGVNSLGSVGQVVPLVVSLGACLSIIMGIIGGLRSAKVKLVGAETELDVQLQVRDILARSNLSVGNITLGFSMKRSFRPRG